MKLYQIMNSLSDIALSQPNIKTSILGDVYRLNALNNVKYGVFSCTQNQHYEEGDFMYFNLNLFYIDRLLEDGSNEINIQSTGISVLHNIIETFQEEYGASVEGNIQYQPFSQKFVDETSGVYAIITFAVPIESTCDEEYNY